MPILEVTELTKSYLISSKVKGLKDQRMLALDRINLRLFPSQSLGVVGESGCGKSTLAKCLVMLERPDSGSIRLSGMEVTNKSGAELRSIRGRIQMVFQDPFSSLNPRMTVRDAILEAAVEHRAADLGTEKFFVSRLLEMIGIPEALADERPNRMSGGQRQRVALARAMAVQPDVLVADEIVSALDVSIQAQILNLLSNIRREFALSVVFISHDLAVVAQSTDRIAVMYLGKIVEEGPTSEIFRHPRHPYTRALLASHPEPGDKGFDAEPSLQGEIPSAFNMPTGCRFRTRCVYATPECALTDPELVQCNGDHDVRVACFVRPFDNPRGR